MARLDSLGIAKQTALGAKQITPEYYVPVESADLGYNVETMEVDETTGHRFPTSLDYGVGYFETSFTGAARAASLPRILSGYFGAPTTTTVGTTGKQHLFNPVGTALVPHSILLNRTDPNPAITDLVWDALGNTLSLNVEPNSFLTFDTAWVAMANDDARPEPTVTLDNSRRFSFDICKGYISVDGGSETEVRLGAWGMEYNNNIDTDQVVLGSRSLYSIAEGNASCDFTFTPRENLSTHFRRALLADPAKVKLRLTGIGAAIPGGTEFYTFEVIAYALEYVSAPANISAGDRLNGIEISARARFDELASKFVEVRVINEVATY